LAPVLARTYGLAAEELVLVSLPVPELVLVLVKVLAPVLALGSVPMSVLV
jgi:hypothetical protein